MPFESKAQQRFMFAKHPEMAKEWADKTPDISSLPEHVKKMAEGGTTSGNPAELDKPAQDATASDFLLPYLLGPSAKGMAEELPTALEGLGETGSITIGRAAPKMEEVAEAASPKVEAFIKGVQKSPNGNEVKIWGVRGDPDEISKLGYGTDPGSVPEHILREKGVLPTAIDASAHSAPNAYAEGGKVERSSLEHPVPNGMMARAMSSGGYPHVTFLENENFPSVKKDVHLDKEASKTLGNAATGHKENYSEGGYPHVTFLENESPAKVKEDTHMEGHKAGPMNTTETGEKENPKHMSQGGEVDPKLKTIYKAMGIKKYADGGTPDIPNNVDPSQLPGGVPPPPPSGPGLMDWLKTFGGKIMNGPAGTVAGMAMNPVSGIANAVEDAAPTIMKAEAPIASSVASTMAGGTMPSPPVAPAPAPVIPPAAPPAVSLPKPITSSGIPAATTSGMPNIGTMFNQDTSKLTEGVNPEDRQALANKLQEQQHGIGTIIAQAVAGLGDALSTKGGRETHALGNIFAMEKTQRDEALANFDKARQDRIQKLQLQTQMGDNALKQAAAADAYGTDEHLNHLLGAPKGTMKKDLPNYMGIMSAGIAAKERDEELYMKSRAQGAADVDSSIKNSTALGFKPTEAQIQARGEQLSNRYYAQAKGLYHSATNPQTGHHVESYDGGQSWVDAGAK